MWMLLLVTQNLMTCIYFFAVHELAGQKDQRAARLLRWMVLRLLTHKVFIEVSFEWPNWARSFRLPLHCFCPTPSSFTPPPPSFAFGTQKCNNKQEQSGRQGTSSSNNKRRHKLAALWLCCFHTSFALCIFFRPLPPSSLFLGLVLSSQPCLQVGVVVVGFLFCTALLSWSPSLPPTRSPVECPSIGFACYLLHRLHLSKQWCQVDLHTYIYNFK